MKSFAEQILEDQTPYNLGNTLWVQFVKDHYRVLLHSCTREELQDNERYKYRYRPEDYALKYNLEVEDTWILSILNKLDPNEGIPLYAKYILVPSREQIDTLKHQFDSYLATLPSSMLPQ